MCGIWASIGTPTTSTLEAAQAGIGAANLRGPDGQRLIQIPTPSGPLYLGHRRLSVYDLHERASQPLSRGPLTAVFNGALYDFKEIREELVAKGIQFTTQGDTEVLLEAWLAWGPSAVTRFDGMFAAIIYDARDNTLHLVRDRFGEKPLHVLARAGLFAAASEINQLSQAGFLESPRANIEVVCDFLELSLAEAGTHTFFQDVQRVPPGQHQVWDLSAATPRLARQEFLFGTNPKIDQSLKDPRVAAQATQEALLLSVRRRMTADVTVGSCLSGGLDSSAIVRLAAMNLPVNRAIECICAVFDETDPSGLDLSERIYANAAADRSGINLQFVTPSADDVAASMDFISARQGEPFAHTSIAVQHFVFKAAREAGIVVMLDGQGADELFGGYSGMLGARLADILTHEGPRAWQQAIAAFGADEADLDPASLKRATLNALIPERARRGLAQLKGRWPNESQLTKRSMRYEPKKLAGLTRFESLMSALVTERSLPGLLRYEDRNAMSFGIETRLPFLSREMAQLATSMPGSVKARDGWTKAVLRDAMAGVIPELVLRRRRKLGFVSPHDRWMAGALRPWVEAGIDLACQRFSEILAPKGVALAREGLGQTASANSSAFRLASLGHWAEANHVAP